MIYNNEFSINKFFTKNYGLPAKPKAVTWKKPKNIIVLLMRRKDEEDEQRIQNC